VAGPVHQDERKAIRRVDAPDEGQLDVFGSKGRFHGRRAGVIPQRPEVSGPAAEARASHHGGGDLAARKLRQSFCARMAIRRRMRRDGRHQIQTVLSEPDDVKRP
jgi:hypothetical protein